MPNASGCATPNCRREHLAGAVSEGEEDATSMHKKEVVVRYTVCMCIFIIFGMLFLNHAT